VLLIRCLHLHQISVAIRRCPALSLLLDASRIAHMTRINLFQRDLRRRLISVLLGALSLHARAHGLEADPRKEDDILDRWVHYLLCCSYLYLLDAFLFEAGHLP